MANTTETTRTDVPYNAMQEPDIETNGAPGNGLVRGHGATGRPSTWPRSGGIGYTLAIMALLVGIAAGIGIGAAIEHNSASTGSSSATGNTALQQAAETGVQAVQPSVVEVTSSTAQGEAIGSGEVLATSGYIVTNDHVVAGYSSYQVTLSNGMTVPAQITGQDAQDDLAVLKVAASNLKSPLKPITFGNSTKATVGEFVIAVGNPLGLEQSATFGIVSALNRTATEAPSGPAGVLTGLIQTSAPINPGNSGGALVTLQGDLIGIPTLSAVDSETNTQADGIGYAIPADRVQYVTSQLMQYGRLVGSGQGFVGLEGEDDTPQLAAANGLAVHSGVLVVGFGADAAGVSPAQQAGIQVGDILTAVNGLPISTSGDLASALTTQQPGTRVTLTVVRGVQHLSIAVTLGERPVNTAG
jgi:S1-C subfamily serine protease